MAKKKNSDSDNKSYDSMLSLFGDIPSEFVDERPITYLPTGHPGFDSILGGGLPQGKFIEYWGDEGSGKTTISLQQAAFLADNGHPIIYMDFEKGLSKALCQSIPGVWDHIQARNIIPLRPTTFPDFDTLFQKYVLRTPKDMKRPIVFTDSVVAIQLSNYMDIDIEGQKMDSRSKARTQMVQKYKTICDAEDITVVWINQRRANIQIGGIPNPYAEKDKASGGTAYAHALDIRLRMKPGKQFYNNSVDKVKIGHNVILKCSKNKFRPGYEKYEIPLVWGVGFSIPRYLHDILRAQGFTKASAGRYKVRKLECFEDMEFPNRDEYFEWLYTNSDVIFNELKLKGYVSDVQDEDTEFSED